MANTHYAQPKVFVVAITASEAIDLAMINDSLQYMASYNGVAVQVDELRSFTVLSEEAADEGNLTHLLPVMRGEADFIGGEVVNQDPPVMSVAEYLASPDDTHITGFTFPKSHFFPED